MLVAFLTIPNAPYKHNIHTLYVSGCDHVFLACTLKAYTTDNADTGILIELDVNTVSHTQYLEP